MIKVQMSQRFKTIALVVASAVFGSLITGTVVSAQDQGNMLSARRQLNGALTSLSNAVADKGGHRENAINLVHQAITEVNLGINYAKTH